MNERLQGRGRSPGQFSLLHLHFLITGFLGPVREKQRKCELRGRQMINMTISWAADQSSASCHLGALKGERVHSTEHPIFVKL